MIRSAYRLTVATMFCRNLFEYAFLNVVAYIVIELHWLHNIQFSTNRAQNDNKNAKRIKKLFTSLVKRVIF